MSDDTVRPLRPGQQQPPELATLVAAMRENIEAHIELAGLQARVTRARYLGLVAEGFTKDEALQLCRP